MTASTPTPHPPSATPGPPDAANIHSAVPRTRIRYSFLKIVAGSAMARRRMPFMSAESAVEPDGPIVWLTACSHGDEVGGIVVIQEVFKQLRRTPLLQGKVLALPLMNPIGFETGSRQITLSGEDLNRSFPGDSQGSFAERIAHMIFRRIADTRPTIVLDFHNDWIRSIPYAVIDPLSGPEHEPVLRQVEHFAAITGFAVVTETEPLPRALSHCLMAHGTPALTMEMGEAYVVNERNVTDGVGSVWNVLAELKMIEPVTAPFRYQLPDAVRGRPMKYGNRPFAATSGIIRFLVGPGDMVKPGQPVARIENAFGRLQETLTAVGEAIVLGHADSSVAFPGAPVMAFGLM